MVTEDLETMEDANSSEETSDSKVSSLAIPHLLLSALDCALVFYAL